jgi:FkbM family methyltransferase
MTKSKSDLARRAYQVFREEGCRSLVSSILLRAAIRLDNTSEEAKKLKALVEDDSPVIIDGGANRGQTIGLMEAIFSEPEIYAFEPIPELADELARTHDSDRIHVSNKGLGAIQETKEFNVTAVSDQSSFLDPSSNVNQRHGGDINRVTKVEVTTIDEALSFLDYIDILKLDLQGFELEALHGGKKSLSDVNIILTEVQFTELYDGAALFCDIVEYLEEHSFYLYDLFSLNSGPSGRLEWGNAIFLSEDYSK